MRITKTGENSLFYSVCTIIILCTTLLLAANTNNINVSLREILSDNHSTRFSGEGTYVRTVYKKAIDVNDFLEGKDFKDEQRKQQYLMLMQVVKGLDFSLKQDKITYTLEKLYFDQDKKRRDYTSLSPAITENIRNKPGLIDTLSLRTFTFDGDKTISLVSPEKPDGTTDDYS